MGRQVTRLIAMGAALVGSGAGIVHHEPAKASEPVTLHYYLTKVDVGASVSQTLVRCNADRRTIEVTTKWRLTADGAADYENRRTIDVSPSFLVERETGLKLYPNETLASFNAASTGQGGAVLSAVVSAAASLAPTLVGLPPIPGGNIQPAAFIDPENAPPIPFCNEATEALLSQRETLNDSIDLIEDAILNRTATRYQVEQLARFQQDLLRVERGLTLSWPFPKVAASFSVPCTEPAPNMCTGSFHVPPLPYSNWLNEGMTLASEGPYGLGFVVSWEAAYQPDNVTRTAGVGNAPSTPERNLVYLRPVPALIVGYACTKSADENCDELRGVDGAAAFAELEFAIPQLSPEYRLPLGGGIFGGRSVQAEFDELGRPTRLSFGSDPGGESIASTIGAASDAIVGFDGARLNAINAEIEMEEALRTLTDLRKPPAPAADDEQ